MSRAERHLLLEFPTSESMLEAIANLRAAGFNQLETYTPWPVSGIDEALNLPKSPVPRIVLFAGLAGAIIAYLIQWWTNAIDFPLIVGNRPAHAAPAFILITFETTVLFAGLASLLAVLALSGLPKLWHPVFEAEGFESASVDAFWIEVKLQGEPLNEKRIREIVAPSGVTKIVEMMRNEE